MSSNIGRGRCRPIYKAPLRRPGETQEKLEQQEEKPPAGENEITTINTLCKDDDLTAISNNLRRLSLTDTDQSDESKDKTLVKAVNAAEFVPASQQLTGASSGVSSSTFSALAVYAREFVPGKAFVRRERTPAERKEEIANFVNTKIKQVEEDPGCTEEISNYMVNYLSLSIKTEDDLAVVADLLFEKCLWDLNFQYCGARIANYLDKNLVVQGLAKQFRQVFLQRCKEASKKINELILLDVAQVPSHAMFFGELLMSYKAVDNKPIEKFRTVLVEILNLLLASKEPKLHISAGKLLKLTGSELGENQDELFATVKKMSQDSSVDSTAQRLFDGVWKSRETSWGKNKTISPSPSPVANAFSDMSLYVPNTDLYLQERSEVPVCGEDEWSEFAIDGEETEYNQMFMQSYLEQYGYLPYATADNAGTDSFQDDYDADLESFMSDNKR